MHNYTIYFKEKEGFERLIKKIYEKYKSLSKFSGTVKLPNLTKEEARCLSRFFGTPYEENSTITIPIKKMLSIMQDSKYEDFDIGTLIEEYLGVSLITNKETAQLKSAAEEEFYQDIIGDNTKGNIWLKEIISAKIEPYKLIHQRYNKNKQSLKRELTNTINLINNLPSEKILLPIYASKHTKDPHYLDLDKNHITLFLYALSWIDKTPYPESREGKIKLLSKYNIEIDNVSNFAITYNLLSNENRINSFSSAKQPLILNIQNIINTKNFNSKHEKVFILENPSILSEIIYDDIEATIIIADGFPNTSVHLLIEKLIASNCHIYYNGDFDPEGLLIAAKLKERYQDNLSLFCYSKIDYDNCISKKQINQARLKKLSKINIEALDEIKNLLLIHKLSAYQENNKERILNFIKKEINNSTNS